MITITANEGKYFFSNFATLINKESITVDETTLTKSEIAYILAAIESKRLSSSLEDIQTLTQLLQTGGNSIDTSSFATKIEVNTLISNLLNNAPETFDTFKEIADWIASNQDAVLLLSQELNSKADTTVATESTNGLMSNTDKVKLNQLQHVEFIQLTQEEYDELAEEAKALPSVLYLIVEE